MLWVRVTFIIIISPFPDDSHNTIKILTFRVSYCVDIAAAQIVFRYLLITPIPCKSKHIHTVDTCCVTILFDTMCIQISEAVVRKVTDKSVTHSFIVSVSCFPWRAVCTLMEGPHLACHPCGLAPNPQLWPAELENEKLHNRWICMQCSSELPQGRKKIQLDLHSHWILGAGARCFYRATKKSVSEWM